MIGENFRKLLVCILLPAFILASLPVLGLAQDGKTGNLKGFVYQSDGKTPQKDAVVILYTGLPGDNTEFSSQPTPKTGNYIFENLPPAIYQVKIRHGGEMFYQKNEIKINPDQTRVAYFTPRNKDHKKDQKNLLAVVADNTLIASFILNKKKTALIWIIPGTIAAALGGVALFTPPDDPTPVSPVTL